MTSSQVVVIGAGHAGVHCAASLVDRGWLGGVVLIDESVHTPYERPPLSKAALKTDAELVFPTLRRDGYYADKKIEIIQGRSVTSIDRAARVVTLDDGSTSGYQKLVLATGARPRRLPVPGGDHPQLTFVKTIDDARRVNRALKFGSGLAIIGAGYIGLEVAAAAAAAGCHVHVLEAADRVMSRVTSEPVSAFFEKLHRDRGVSLTMNAHVVEVRDAAAGVEVVCADGLVESADLVVVGIGIEPNDELAAAAGLDCADGVLVDAHACTNDPDIYALGDITRFESPDGKVSLRLECVQNALDQAEAAANHIVGRSPAPPGVPWFWTIQHGVRLQTAGLRRPDDEIVVRGAAENGKFSVLYLRSGRLVAIDTIKSLKDFNAGKHLIAAGTTIDRERAENPTIPLAECGAATAQDQPTDRTKAAEKETVS
ncbi:hypothetical protein EEB14_13360 [Rhodococcus sp. WS4]|nr:hypothetical protein EEB14_13360 [Rhodococcus sp. WS4]